MTRRTLIARSVEDDVRALLAKGIAFFQNNRLDVQDDIEAMITRHGARPVIDCMAGINAGVVRGHLVGRRGFTIPASMILEKHLGFLLATELLRPYDNAVRSQMEAAMAGHPPPRLRPADAAGVIMAMLGLHLTTVIEAAGTRPVLE